MTLKSSHELLDTYVDAFNGHDSARLASLHTDSAKVRIEVTAPVVEGHQQIAEFYDGIFSGWPDCKWEKTHAFGRDGMMCMEWTFTGSSIKYPDAPVRMWDCGVFKVENGKVAEVRFYIDTGTIAKQWESQGVLG